MVDQVKARFPGIMAVAPKGMKVALTFDQSVFVKRLCGMCSRKGDCGDLVAIMVLVFVGSARSMLIVITSIPLSILTSIIVLNIFGQTINTMTLGGLALAVGMLVDDATVEVENIHRNHTPGKHLVTAILEGAAQIATPTLVGTLSICVVFFPSRIAGGSGTLSFPSSGPCRGGRDADLLSAVENAGAGNGAICCRTWSRPRRPPARRFPSRFERGFERVRQAYSRALGSFIAHRLARADRRGCDDRRFSAADVGGGPGFLSECGFRTDAASRPRTHWDQIESTEWLINKIDSISGA